MRQRPMNAVWAALLGLVAGFLASTAAEAAVLPIAASTYADFPTPGKSTPTTGWYLTGLTSGGVTSASLIDSVVTGSITTSGVLATSGEYLGNTQDARRAMLSGPSVTTGLGNVPQADIAFRDALGNPVTFSTGDDYRFYFFEYGADNAAQFTLLDTAMQPIAGYSLTISAASYGPLLPKVASDSPDAILYNNGSQGSTTGGGVTFDLDDFGYTGMTPVAGLRYAWVGSETDPMTFGAYAAATVPEPGALALSAAGLGFLLVQAGFRRKVAGSPKGP